MYNHGVQMLYICTLTEPAFTRRVVLYLRAFPREHYIQQCFNVNLFICLYIICGTLLLHARWDVYRCCPKSRDLKTLTTKVERFQTSQLYHTIPHANVDSYPHPSWVAEGKGGA